MPKNSRYATKGQEALESLTNLVGEHWPHLTAAERETLQLHLDVKTPEELMKAIRSLIAWIGVPTAVTIPARTVQARRDRQKERIAKDLYTTGSGEELGKTADGVLKEDAPDVSMLRHLEPATEEDQKLFGEHWEEYTPGAAVLREQSEYVSKPKPKNVSLRMRDDRTTALRYSDSKSLTVRQLYQIQQRVARVRVDLDHLRQTSLARGILMQDPRPQLVPTRQGLDWYHDTFLEGVIDEANNITSRFSRDTRRLVLKLLHTVKIATGRPQLPMICDVLNWWALRPKRVIWNSTSLRRWAAGSLTSVRQVFIERMPNDFDHFIRDEISKQSARHQPAQSTSRQLRVVLDERAADGILHIANPGEETRGIPVTLPGQEPAGPTLCISLLDASKMGVLWPAEADGRECGSSVVSTSGGLRERAAQLVSQLLKALSESARMRTRHQD